MRKIVKTFVGVQALIFVMSAFAQQPIVYPAKGQTPDQQSRDDAECYSWSKQSTGIDPAVVAQTPPPVNTGSTVGSGDRLRGAGRGALGGAAIGAIAGDTGQGAAIGAVVGTMAGGHRARQNQQAQNEQAMAQHQQMMDTFFRAYSACMEGRGYTIR